MGNGFLGSMPPELYDSASGDWTVVGEAGDCCGSATLLLDGKVLVAGGVACSEATNSCFRDGSAKLYDPVTGTWTTTRSMLQEHQGAPATLLLDGTVLVAGGDTGSAELYAPAGVTPPTGLPTAAPIPIPTSTPIPTAVPTPFPPAAGPIPPDARSWTVTVSNRSAEPATLFVAEEDERGLMGPLVGSATPNVVAPGATVAVTFLIPAKGTDWVIYVNPRPNDGGLVGPAEMALAGQIQINILTSGQPAWSSP